MKYDSVLDLIGDTPLVRIAPEVHRVPGFEVYAKLEMANPFGSVKDRTAWAMAAPELAAAIERGSTVVELSSGNTAKALAILASMHGLGFKSVTNRMKIPEMRELLLLLGAQLEELPGQAECLDPNETEEPLARFHRALLESEEGWLHTDQYFNPRNRRAHADGTGVEILKDLDGRCPDVFAACVGTAGSSTGVAMVLRRANPKVRVVGLVADKADFIPGIRTIDEAREVGLFQPDAYDHLAAVTSAEAIEAMVTLNRRCGILGGPTSGAAYAGMLRYLLELTHAEQPALGQPALGQPALGQPALGQPALGQPALGQPARTAVFIVCDRVESYLSYVRRRRPDLLRQPAVPHTIDTVTEAEAAAAQRIDVPAALGWIADENPLIIDLRGPYAFAALHLPGSINIVDEIFAELVRGELPVGPERPVLLVCPVGERSARYAALLTRLGHPNARSLAGGVVAWRDAAAPLTGN